MYGPGPRRRYSALGVPPGAAIMPPYCSSTADARPLYQTMSDLGLYMGPFEPTINSSLSQAICSFAKTKGMDHVCQHGPDLAFCQALMAEWEARFGAGATPPKPPDAPPETPPRIDPALIRAAGRRIMTQIPGGEAAPPPGDPIAMCQAGGGTWDHVAMTCLMQPPGFWAGLSPAAKAGLIGGVLVALGVAGYGIYAATR